MFGRKEITKNKNEVMALSAKVLKILYMLLIAVSIYIVVILFKETKILLFLKTLLKVVFPLFIGLIIAWLFDPFVKWLEKKGIKRIWGAVITYFIILLVLFITIYTLVPSLIEEIKELIRMAPSIMSEIKRWANDFVSNLDGNGIFDAQKLKVETFKFVEEFSSNLTTTMPKHFLGFIYKLFSWIGTFILGLIIGFFLIVNFENSNKLFKFIPKKFRESSEKLLDNINISLRSYVKGAIIDCTLIFILSTIGLWLCGLRVPILFGLFCGITNIIPYAGPYIGGAPAVIVGFTQSPMTGIMSLIVIAVIQFLEGNFLQPIIMSKTTKLHPVTIILGLLVFGHFFGIVGMLISTPTIASLKTIFKFLDEKYEIIKKDDIEISHEKN